MIELAARARNLPAPPGVVFESLTRPERPGARPWLDLVDDEVAPRILSAEADRRLVWSSLWPTRPDDEVHFELAPEAGGTRLRFVLLTPEEMPSDGELGRLRFRLNKILWADLRLSYGQ
ncbi:uncharacterized protein YndB with AHSA1/START domain [Nocardioides sp. BE266]|uniref:SRPBCC family protein n=1 Tax=Nocardioides sp. BE266 TaxID=2817725 RepID=UPI002866603B|nr:hypothetical protein [Nocardioides sp. BE266]MDR7251831.1 uncharacterized protein YndB with AHSA1/START domain [Nocardioides sp. BE266]